MKKFLAVAAVSLASVVGVAGVVGPASAAEASVVKESSIREASIREADASATNEAAAGAGMITRSTTAYISPSTNSGVRARFDQGTMVTTICYTEGERFNDNPYWFRVSRGADTGFVHRDAISLSTTNLPHC